MYKVIILDGGLHVVSWVWNDYSEATAIEKEVCSAETAFTVLMLAFH
jgi:hypothetical protein